MRIIKVYTATTRHLKVLIISQQCVSISELFSPNKQTECEVTLDPGLVLHPSHPPTPRTTKPDQWLHLWSVTTQQQQAVSAGSVWKRDVCRLQLIQGSGQVRVNISTAPPSCDPSWPWPSCYTNPMSAARLADLQQLSECLCFACELMLNTRVDRLRVCWRRGWLLAQETLGFHVFLVCYSKKRVKREGWNNNTTPEAKTRGQCSSKTNEKRAGAKIETKWNKKHKKDKNRNQTAAQQVATNCNPNTTMTNRLNNTCSVPPLWSRTGSWACWLVTVWQQKLLGQRSSRGKTQHKHNQTFGLARRGLEAWHQSLKENSSPPLIFN